MKSLILFIAAMIIGFQSFTQIDLNQEAEKQKKEKKVKPDSLKATLVYGAVNWSYCDRALKENEGLFAEPLGDRANEIWMSNFSYSLGVQNTINRFLFWDGGISYLTNGERLIIDANDTTTTTTRQYHFIAMPLHINAYYEKKVRLSFGAGLIPQMMMKDKQTVEVTPHSTGNTTSTSTKSKTGYNSFVLSASLNVGLLVPISKNFSMWFSPEVRFQLNSSYMKTQPYIHKARAYGINVGLTFKM